MKTTKLRFSLSIKGTCSGTSINKQCNQSGNSNGINNNDIINNSSDNISSNICVCTVSNIRVGIVMCVSTRGSLFE